MANKKTDVSVLVRGLGMGMAFLQALTEEIVAAGGFEEMIHFLTKEGARPICKAIAKVVVESAWQVPRSLVQRLALEYHREQGYDAESIAYDAEFWWTPVLNRLGIPYVQFDLSQGSAVPQSIIAQMIGKKHEQPMVVQYEGESYVVVHYFGGLCCDNNDVITSMVSPEQLDIALTKFFNLEQ